MILWPSKLSKALKKRIIIAWRTILENVSLFCPYFTEDCRQEKSKKARKNMKAPSIVAFWYHCHAFLCVVGLNDILCLTPLFLTSTSIDYPHGLKVIEFIWPFSTFFWSLTSKSKEGKILKFAFDIWGTKSS